MGNVIGFLGLAVILAPPAIIIGAIVLIVGLVLLFVGMRRAPQRNDWLSSMDADQQQDGYPLGRRQ